jgi:FkbM family methyltransferase
MNINKLGTEYGKHYVILELLNSKSLVYSFGIGEDISFDIELMNHIDCEIFAFDPTPKSIEWLKQQVLPEKFHIFEYGISDRDGLISFDAPPNPNWASYKESSSGIFQFNVKSIKSIMQELGHSSHTIDFLKLDIEGSEYSVLDNIIKNSIFPSQISVEFHGSLDYIKKWISDNNELKKNYHIYLFPDNEVFLLKK